MAGKGAKNAEKPNAEKPKAPDDAPAKADARSDARAEVKSASKSDAGMATEPAGEAAGADGREGVGRTSSKRIVAGSPAPRAPGDERYDVEWSPPDDVRFVRHPNIHSAKRGVMAELKAIIKKKQGTLNYKAMGIEDLTEALEPLLARHGVIPAPEGVEVELSDTYESRSGTQMRFIRLKVTYCLHHADSDTSVPAVGLGEGTDTGDKAGYKALSGAYKYALWQSFCVPVLSEDPDRHDSARAEPARQQEARQSRPAAVAQPAAQGAAKPAPGATSGATPGAANGSRYSSTFYRRKERIESEVSLDKLKANREVYLHDGANTEEEIKLLEQAYEARVKALPRPASALVEE